MGDETLSAALEHEHTQVDAGLEAFLEKLDVGTVDEAGLTQTLNFLRRHIYLEEQILFPPIGQGALMMALFGMIRGHGEIWRTMDTLAALSVDGTDHDNIRATCQQLVTLLAAHNKVEEPVIYPAADSGLEPDTAAELAEFLKAGVMPDGWVCEKAG